MRGLLSVGAFLSLLLSGCSITQTAAPTPERGMAIAGTVHGGQSAISGSHVFVMSANVTAFDSQSLSLLENVPGTTVLDTAPGPTNGDYYVPTDANGNFRITGDYLCTPDSQVYLYASGGNPGMAPGTNNTAIGLIALLGNCSSTGTFAVTIPRLIVNEVTTVVGATAIAPFAADATHVSSDGSAPFLIGIGNAFRNATNMENLTTGLALATTPAGNGTVPQAQLHSEANSLAACVNSASPSSTACTGLFGAAGFLGNDGVNAVGPPTNTANAAINIAHNPGANVGTIFGLGSAAPPFQPALASAPSDFTVSITYTDPSLTNPLSLAINSQGDVITANTSCNCLTELSSLGARLKQIFGGGLNVPEYVSIDQGDGIWVINALSSGISNFSSTGVALSPTTGYTDPSLNTPIAFAFDISDNVYIPNYNTSTVTELNNSGALVKVISGGGVAQPVAIAFGPSGNFYVQNYYDSTVSFFNGSGSPIIPSPGVSLPGANEIAAMAVGPSGNIYLLNEGIENGTGTGLVNNTGTLFLLSPAGVVLSPPGGYSCPGLNSFPTGLAIAGDGNEFVASTGNNRGGFCSLNFIGQGSPETPVTTLRATNSQLSYPSDEPVSSDGSAWTTNYTGNSVTQTVGVAAPVVTPLASSTFTTGINARGYIYF